MQFPKFAFQCALVVCALIPASIAAAQQNGITSHANASVNNQDVIRMTKAQFDDATIVKTILAFNTDLDVSVTGLMELKEAGVTQTVIQAMLTKTADESKAHLEHQNSVDGTATDGSSPSRASTATIPDATYSRHANSEIANQVNRETATKSGRDSRPRVFLESVSRGSNRNAAGSVDGNGQRLPKNLFCEDNN